MRECGECSVCCVVGYVPELEKAPHTPCQHIKTEACGSCAIFEKKELPETCSNYRCCWLNEYGKENDRPDKNGVMFSDNILENQRFTTAIEMEDGAFSRAKEMVIEIIEEIDAPMIVVKYGKKPPEDTGDWVAISDKLLPRCTRIAGDLIERLNDEIGLYELVKGK